MVSALNLRQHGGFGNVVESSVTSLQAGVSASVNVPPFINAISNSINIVVTNPANSTVTFTYSGGNIAPGSSANMTISSFRGANLSSNSSIPVGNNLGPISAAFSLTTNYRTPLGFSQLYYSVLTPVISQLSGYNYTKVRNTGFLHFMGAL